MDTVQSSPQRELYEDNPATGSPHPRQALRRLKKTAWSLNI